MICEHACPTPPKGPLALCTCTGSQSESFLKVSCRAQMTSEFPNSRFSSRFLMVSEVLVIACFVRGFHSMVTRHREKQVRKISFWLVVSGLSLSRQRGAGQFTLQRTDNREKAGIKEGARARYSPKGRARTDLFPPIRPYFWSHHLP